MNHLISSFAFVGALFLASCGNAQSTGPASANNQPAPKVSWLTDFEKSKTIAAETDRLILVNFTGSDWCPPCMQLKKDVFSTDDFATYASENLVLLELDFPRQKQQPEDLKRQNQKLAGEFDVAGFPTLVLLNPDGEEVKRFVGYLPGGPAKFMAWVDEARMQ